jgi:hypothetical protein
MGAGQGAGRRLAARAAAPGDVRAVPAPRRAAQTPDELEDAGVARARDSAPRLLPPQPAPHALFLPRSSEERNHDDQ